MRAYRLGLGLSLVLAAGFATGIHLSPAPAAAQRPQPSATPQRPRPSATLQRPLPTATPGADAELALRRFGTRHVLAAVGSGAGGASSSAIQVVNTGWRPTNLLVVGLESSGADDCAAGGPRITGYATFEVLASRYRGTQFTTEAHFGSGGMGDSALVYSLHADLVNDLDASFLPVVQGQMSLAEWEDQVWRPHFGEPVAVSVVAETDGAATAFESHTPLDGGAVAGRPLRHNRVLPLAWTERQGARTRVMNGGSACLQARSRIGGDTEACSPPQGSALGVAAYDSATIAPRPAGAEVATFGLAPQNQNPSALSDAALVADRLDASGWVSLAGRGMGPAAESVLLFPMAVVPLPNLKSELWVTNEHVTATAQVSLLMFDGNLNLRPPYQDPVPLCPGGTRRYDIQAIAGEIPPTTGRGDQPGPPLLSLRVEATSTQLPTFVPVSGAMRFASDLGATAYSGFIPPVELAAFRARPGMDRGGMRTEIVVPGVKRAVGDERLSTMLSVMAYSPQTENAITIDLHDALGRPVATGIRVQMGQGPAAYLDLGALPPRQGVPEGFQGTAVIRGAQNRGTLAAIALDRPAAPAARPQPTPIAPDQANRRDRVWSYSGSLLPQWPDPSVPTPTLVPTRMAPTPTATGARPTLTPEVTPTPPPQPPLVWLPLLLKQPSEAWP